MRCHHDQGQYVHVLSMSMTSNPARLLWLWSPCRIVEIKMMRCRLGVKCGVSSARRLRTAPMVRMQAYLIGITGTVCSLDTT
eukprot:4946842-Amphidinium_carterae.1